MNKHLAIAVGFFCLTVLVISCRRTPSTPFAVTLRADVGSLVTELANDGGDTLLKRAIAVANGNMGDATKPYSVLLAEAYRQQHADRPLVTLFSKNSGLPGNAPDEAVAVWLDKEIAKAVQQAAKILSGRLAEVHSADVVVRMNRGRGFLQVSCKTDRNSDELKALLTMTGKLEFFRAYSNYDVFPMLQNLNSVMAPEDTSSVNVTGGDTAHLVMSGHAQSMAAKNPLFMRVAPNVDVGSGQLNDGPVFGMVATGDQRWADSVFSSPAAHKTLPLLMKMYPGKVAEGDKVIFYYAAKIQPTGGAEVNNVHISKAEAEKRPGLEPEEYAVYLYMTEPGKLRWKKMTGECIGGYIMVVVDGRVVSCPRVLNEIPSGQTEIGGKFTKQAARDLAAILKCGNLPVALSVADKATETITEL